MLVYYAKHTKTQCASASKGATCTHVRMFFFRRPHATKICRQEWTFNLGKRHAQVSQYYPLQE